MNTDQSTVQTDQKTLAAGVTEVELWLRKIKRAQDDEKDWRDDAREAVKIFEAEDEKDVAFNLYNSNVETIMPAVYNSTPVPDVRRRFGDKDPIGKEVVDVSERAISFSIDQYIYDDVMESAIQDMYVTGRGFIRLRYSAETDGGRISRQDARIEHVPWDKWGRGPARSWDKVPFIFFEHDLTEDEVKKLNPKIVGELKFSTPQDDEDKSEEKAKGVYQTTKVLEVWDKVKRRVLFIAACYKLDFLLDIADPLGLEEFYPGWPMQRIRRSSGLVPVCPYKVYNKLLDELDTTTKRITKLVKQLKVRGLIPGELDQDIEQVKTLEDGQFITAKSAVQFASGAGGLDKMIWTWPMDPTVKALQQLYVQREQIKQNLYEVSGTADIMRGATDPNETLGAQQLKTQWGSLRVQRAQRMIANVNKMIFRAHVQLFAKKYTDENLAAMTGLPDQSNQQQVQMWPQVMQLFRSDMRAFRIDIETDSTVRADLTRNQEQMNSFLDGASKYLQAVSGAIPILGNAVVPTMVEVFTSMARNYKLGKQADDALAQLSQLSQQAAQQPKQPSPEEQKAQAEMQQMQMQAQMDMQSKQADLQMKSAEMQMKAQHEERMMQIAEQKAAMELQIKQLELQMKREEIGLNMQAKQMEMSLKAEGQRQQFAMDQQSREADMEMQHEQNELKRQGMADKAKFDKQAMANKAKMQAQRPRSEARA